MKAFFIAINVLVVGCLWCTLISVSSGSDGRWQFPIVIVIAYSFYGLVYLAKKSSEEQAKQEKVQQAREEISQSIPIIQLPAQLVHAEAPQEKKSGDAVLARETVLGEKQPLLGRYVKVKDKDRQSGMYVLGVQGVGKSSLLENIIYQDIRKGQAVIVLDPHGDLIEHVISQIPQDRLKDIYVFSIEDIDYPFGVNLFHVKENATVIEREQAKNRLLHVFQKCFPETKGVWLEKYLGNIAPVFAAYSDMGYGMTDIPRFLQDETFRAKLLKKNVGLFIRQFWQNDYASMSASVRRGETESLATRINRFMRSAIVANIIGQSHTTIDFREAIENNEVILIKLPVNTLQEDATLIGTMLVAQIHAAIFSFADTELEKRPGFSLFVDEFQHFTTSDFAEMFREGRKFGSRVAIAHQGRDQLPSYLQSATMGAYTKITFQTSKEDAHTMADLYTEIVKPEVEVDTDPVKRLLAYAGDNENTKYFVETYLRSLLEVEILPPLGNEHRSYVPGTTPYSVAMMERDRREARRYSEDRVEQDREYVLSELNRLFYQVQVSGNWQMPLPLDLFTRSYYFNQFSVVTAFKAIYYQTSSDDISLEYLITYEAVATQEQLANTQERVFASLTPKILRAVQIGSFVDNYADIKKRDIINFLQFLVSIRALLHDLVQNPIGKQKEATKNGAVQKILNLSRGEALVRVGNEVSEMKTLPTPKRVAAKEVTARKEQIVEQTRKKYCRPALEVEEEIQKRLEMVQRTQEASELQEKATPKQPDEKQDWQPFDEV